jgi:hypothetical protein
MGAEAAAAAQVAGAAGASGGGSEGMMKGLSTGINVVGGVMSLTEAAKQARAKSEADKAARAASDAALEKLNQNFFAGIQLPMEQYDRALRNVRAVLGQGLEGAKEGDVRNLAATVGRSGMVGKENVLDITSKAADDLYKLNVMKANADQNIAKNIGDFEMQRAKGAQLASMAAERARVAAMQQAMQQFGQAAVKGEGMANPTYARGSEQLQSEDIIKENQVPVSLTPSPRSGYMPELSAYGYNAYGPSQYPGLSVNPELYGWQGTPYLLNR